jgi:hypothetical protein
MATPGLVSQTPGITQTSITQPLSKRPLKNRLNHHLRDKHKGRWDRFSVYLTIGATHIKELESLVLRIVQPKGNSQRGNIGRAQNLKRKLARDITAHYRRELDDVLNRKRSVKGDIKSIRDSGAVRSFVGLSGKRLKLRGQYKRKWYHARLLLNGKISFGGKQCRTPSEAAKAAIGKPKHGWWFWRYERAPGDWVRLRELKRR